MPKRILVVEDDENLLKLECILLSSAGYLAWAAMTGPDALYDIANDLPDLILLDIMLPGMDGFEVCKRLKMNARTQHIPVIFLSGKSSPEDIHRGLQVGGDQYITKPFKSSALMNSIQQVFENKASPSTSQRLLH